MFLFDEGGESNVEFLISKLGKSAYDSTHRRVKNMYLRTYTYASLSRSQEFSFRLICISLPRNISSLNVAFVR